MTPQTTQRLSGECTEARPRRERPSHRILTAISDAREIDVTEVESLYETIDLDVVDDLYRKTGTDCGRPARLTFVAAGCRITLSHDGAVYAEPLNSSEGSDVSRGG